MSCFASASTQSRNVAILERRAVALGHTIQYAIGHRQRQRRRPHQPAQEQVAGGARVVREAALPFLAPLSQPYPRVVRRSGTGQSPEPIIEGPGVPWGGGKGRKFRRG